MSNCRVAQDTKEEILRVQEYLEFKGITLTQGDIMNEGLKVVKRNYNIPNLREEITERDLVIKRNILRKRGVEYKSWVLGN